VPETKNAGARFGGLPIEPIGENALIFETNDNREGIVRRSASPYSSEAGDDGVDAGLQLPRSDREAGE
jgi:hypothetical protein